MIYYNPEEDRFYELLHVARYRGVEDSMAFVIRTYDQGSPGTIPAIGTPQIITASVFFEQFESLQKLSDRRQKLERFRSDAFEANPNIDLDIERLV